MEPIGFCGGGLVGLALILAAVLGVALLGGGVILVLVKLGVVIDRWAKPEVRGESNSYTLQQTGTAAEPEKEHSEDAETEK